MRFTLPSALLALVLPVAIAPSLSAQSKILVGPMAGLSLAGWHGPDVPSNFGWQIGFAGGIFVRAISLAHFTFEPQLLIVRKGVKVDLGDGNSGTIKEDLLELPALFKLNLPLGNSNLVPNLFAGPAIGIKASCRTRTRDANQIVEDSCGNTGIRLKSVDWSAIVGAGLDIKRVFLQARYDYSLTRLGDYSDARGVKNHAFLLTVGYTL